jgi:hypothetical protein
MFYQQRNETGRLSIGEACHRILQNMPQTLINFATKYHTVMKLITVL